MTYEVRLEHYLHTIETELGDWLDTLWPYGKLVDAMSYSLLSGGKRIRPVLALEACRFCGAEPEDALPFACALEMVHCYSLIHDDLPCMDDDDFRRGKPTNHKVYGQATAVLAGDALLTAAFDVIANAPGFTPAQTVAAVRTLAEAAGPSGMVAGQILDMQETGHAATVKQIQTIQALKTGKLIVAAVQLGAIAANADQAQTKALCDYAERIGLAFQVQDDILDCEGDETELGKPIGSDRENGKATFVELLGLEVCRKMVQDLTAEALSALEPYAENDFLTVLAQQLAERRK